MIPDTAQSKSDIREQPEVVLAVAAVIAASIRSHVSHTGDLRSLRIVIHKLLMVTQVKRNTTFPIAYHAVRILTGAENVQLPNSRQWREICQDKIVSALRLEMSPQFGFIQDALGGKLPQPPANVKLELKDELRRTAELDVATGLGAVYATEEIAHDPYFQLFPKLRPDMRPEIDTETFAGVSRKGSKIIGKEIERLVGRIIQLVDESDRDWTDEKSWNALRVAEVAFREWAQRTVEGLSHLANKEGNRGQGPFHLHVEDILDDRPFKWKADHPWRMSKSGKYGLCQFSGAGATFGAVGGSTSAAVLSASAAAVKGFFFGGAGGLLVGCTAGLVLWWLLRIDKKEVRSEFLNATTLAAQALETKTKELFKDTFDEYFSRRNVTRNAQEAALIHLLVTEAVQQLAAQMVKLVSVNHPAHA